MPLEALLSALWSRKSSTVRVLLSGWMTKSMESFLPSTSRSVAIGFSQSASRSKVQLPPGSTMLKIPSGATCPCHLTSVSRLSAVTVTGSQPP